MALTLHYHPLSSFCWKVLIGLYENDTPFEPVVIAFGDAASEAAFRAIWPVARMPVLQDAARGATVPESSVIYDYLDLHHPGAVRFTPEDPEAAWKTRLWDRFFDNYVMVPMQRVVADRLRAEDAHDPTGVAEARQLIATAYGVLEAELADGRTWMMGEAFGLADCAAAPSLHYADKVAPLEGAYPQVSAYLARLQSRPSFARVLTEAEPYLAMFPT